MGDVLLTPVLPGDVERVAGDLREMDTRECAAFGFTPLEGVRQSVERAFWVGAVVINGEAEGLYGVGAVSLLSGLGRPWLLGTPRLGEQRRALVQITRRELARFETVFPRLENWMHADNEMSARWLRRLGFEVEAETVLVGDQVMRRFTKGL